ncbi:MAG: hypothetical protein KAI47_09995, partial [Deltaproteobacteria bacterium]|nr:hypothetical protein [Deltaproteobacteria bacterium]
AVSVRYRREGRLELIRGAASSPRDLTLRLWPLSPGGFTVLRRRVSKSKTLVRRGAAWQLILPGTLPSRVHLTLGRGGKAWAAHDDVTLEVHL